MGEKNTPPVWGVENLCSDAKIIIRITAVVKISQLLHSVVCNLLPYPGRYLHNHQMVIYVPVTQRCLH